MLHNKARLLMRSRFFYNKNMDALADEQKYMKLYEENGGV